MTILELFKKVHPSVLAAKMIFKHLQDNFPVLKISDIADTSSGGTPNRGMIEYYNGDIPWVKSGELKDGVITSCDEYITEAGLKNSSAKLFPKGTLLVAMYGANIGKTGVLDFDATTNQAVCAIFPKVDISKDFLFWYFKQQRIEFIAIGKGGAQPNISQTVINNASIVVPEPKIQKKIVDFLEAIEQGKGIDNNFFIPEVLEDVERIYKYKNSYIDLSDSFENQLNKIENLNQAILQEAVQGKLVKQDKKDEPVSELLKRIKAEKVKSGKKEKPLPPIKPEEIPFEIPENWVWCRLGEMFDIERGSSPRPKGDPRYFSKLKTPFNWITISDMTAFAKDAPLSDTREYLTELGTKHSRYVTTKDIIIVASGSAGRTSLLGIDGFIYDGLMSVKNIEFDEMRIFLYYLFRVFEASMMKVATGATWQNINTDILKNQPIPLPPLSEQKHIVVEIEKQLAKTKQLKEHIIANQQATEQLLKALLHQAFEVEEMEEV
jgi:type I restriction enzyme S subunit